MTSPSSARGHRQEHVVGTGDARGRGVDAQLRGQLDTREVHAVLALLGQLGGLLLGARLKRRAQPAAGQQHRQRGAERARPDHRRAPGPR